MSAIRIVNVANHSPGDPFVDLGTIDGRPVEWIGHSGCPRNLIERRIQRPQLSRYRAALGSVRDLARADVLITHLPLMTAAVEHFTPPQLRRAHLAYAFNFTTLPTGAKRRLLARAFRGVTQFCVFSTYEIGLYSDLFEIDPARFRHILWTQHLPPVDHDMDVPERPYVVAIGGEGRDFGAVIEAARRSPDVDWVIVARPHQLLQKVAPNMRVHFNLPLAQTWGLASKAAAVTVPLITDATCCGHLTIVSAQLLGVPVITTRSHATADYVAGFGATTVLNPGDPSALADAARAAVDTVRASRAAAAADIALAQQRYDPVKLSAYVTDFLIENVLRQPLDASTSRH